MFGPETDTVTPGKTAPELSFTVPEMPPVVRCAQTGSAASQRRAKAASNLRMANLLIPFGASRGASMGQDAITTGAISCKRLLSRRSRDAKALEAALHRRELRLERPPAHRVTREGVAIRRQNLALWLRGLGVGRLEV